MLTQKRKQKDRKQKLQRVYILFGLMFVGVITAYLISLKLFPEYGYISPLASKVLSDTVHDEEKAYEMIRKGLQKVDVEVSAIAYRDDAYIITLAKDAEVVLSAKKDLTVQISSLQFMLQRLTMEGSRFSRLDLRFDKPVIVLEK